MWCIIVLCAAVETNYLKKNRKEVLCSSACKQYDIYALSLFFFIFKNRQTKEILCCFKIGMRRVTIKQLKHNH